jgi:hypothetical protein
MAQSWWRRWWRGSQIERSAASSVVSREPEPVTRLPQPERSEAVKTLPAAQVASVTLTSLEERWQEKNLAEAFGLAELKALAPSAWLIAGQTEPEGAVTLPSGELRDFWQQGTPGISRRTLHQLVPTLFSAPEQSHDFLALPRYRVAALLGLSAENTATTAVSSLQRVREGKNLSHSAPRSASPAWTEAPAVAPRSTGSLAEAQMMLRALFHLDQAPTASELIEIIARQPAVAAAWMIHPRGLIMSQSTSASPQWARWREPIISWSQEMMRLGDTLGAEGEMTHSMSFGGRTLSLFTVGSCALIVAQSEDALSAGVRDRFMLTARQLEPLLIRSSTDPLSRS